MTNLSLMDIINRIASREARFYKKEFKANVKNLAINTIYHLISSLDEQEDDFNNVRIILIKVWKDPYFEDSIENLFEKYRRIVKNGIL